jgi:hypothetical protein
MTQGSNPIEQLREQAAQTTPRQVRQDLDTQAQAFLALLLPHGWLAGAEAALRTAIGMERKMGMEMRIGLGEAASQVPHRLTALLSEMPLDELLAEARSLRAHTLRLLDLALQTARHRDVRIWTLGEEVTPDLYAVGLRGRLAQLHLAVEAQRAP